MRKGRTDSTPFRGCDLYPCRCRKEHLLGKFVFSSFLYSIVHSPAVEPSDFFASLFLANFPLPTPPHKCIRPSWASYRGGVATNRHQERGRPAASPSLSHCNGWCSPRRDSAKSPPPVFSGRGGGECAFLQETSCILGRSSAASFSSLGAAGGRGGR